MGPDPSASGAPRINVRRCKSLAVDQRDKDQKADNADRPFGDHADETIEGFFLNFDVHFAVLVVGHCRGPLV
jgi:hypothetical protein